MLSRSEIAQLGKLSAVKSLEFLGRATTLDEATSLAVLAADTMAKALHTLQSKHNFTQADLTTLFDAYRRELIRLGVEAPQAHNMEVVARTAYEKSPFKQQSQRVKPQPAVLKGKSQAQMQRKWWEFWK